MNLVLLDPPPLLTVFSDTFADGDTGAGMERHPPWPTPTLGHAWRLTSIPGGASATLTNSTCVVQGPSSATTLISYNVGQPFAGRVTEITCTLQPGPADFGPFWRVGAGATGAGDAQNYYTVHLDPGSNTITCYKVVANAGTVLKQYTNLSPAVSASARYTVRVRDDGASIRIRFPGTTFPDMQFFNETDLAGNAYVGLGKGGGGSGVVSGTFYSIKVESTSAPAFPAAPAYPTIYESDDFAAPDGTENTGRHPRVTDALNIAWGFVSSGGTTTHTIQGGELAITGDQNQTNIATLSTGKTDVDVTVTCNFNGAAAEMGPIVRSDGTTAQRLGLHALTTSGDPLGVTGRLVLQYYVSGGPSGGVLIGYINTPIGLSADFTLRLVVQGTSAWAFVNGALVMYETFPAAVNGTVHGVERGGAGNAAAAVLADNFALAA